MRFFTLTAFAALASIVAAVDPSSTASTDANSTAAANVTQVPCQTTCYANNFNTSGCVDNTNVTCLCESPVFQAAVYTCLLSTCATPADISNAIEFGISACMASGVNITGAESSNTTHSANGTTTATASKPTTAPTGTSSNTAATATTSTKSNGGRLSVQVVGVFSAIFLGFLTLA